MRLQVLLLVVSQFAAQLLKLVVDDVGMVLAFDGFLKVGYNLLAFKRIVVALVGQKADEIFVISFAQGEFLRLANR